MDSSNYYWPEYANRPRKPKAWFRFPCCSFTHYPSGGKADEEWISAIRERAIRNNEQWTIVTRDSMHENRQILFASIPPLKFALLASPSWNKAKRAELEKALLAHWPNLASYSERTKTGVFAIDFKTGEATDRRPNEPGRRRSKATPQGKRRRRRRK